MIVRRDQPLANDHPDQPDSSPSKPFYLLLQILGSMFNLNNVFLFIYGAILLSGHVRHRKLKNLKLFWQGQKKTSTFAVEKSMTWNYSMHKTLLKGRFITPGIRLLFQFEEELSNQRNQNNPDHLGNGFLGAKNDLRIGYTQKLTEKIEVEF